LKVDQAQIQAMYEAYRSGVRVVDIAAQYNVAEVTVYKKLRMAGLPVGLFRTGNNHGWSAANCERSNATRARETSLRRAAVAQAVAADPALPDIRRLVARVQSENPGRSLSELGELCEMSKHQFAGCLRRALAAHKKTA
jgi:hypothetical protein